MRYEELKKQTQAELKATLDDLLEGDDKVLTRKYILIRSFRISQPISQSKFPKTLRLVYENHNTNHFLKQVFKVDVLPLKIKSRRWDFNLDIAAPQIIMPENFSDQNTILVVFDLGRLQFHNLQSTPTSPSGISEENDGLFII